MQAHLHASAVCISADPPFQLAECYPDAAAAMWQQAAQQPQLAFVPTGAEHAAACEPGLGASYPAAPGWQQGPAYHGYLPMVASGPQPVVQEPQQAADALGGKKRLRWSAALHARFVDAVKQLGGALQATPKRIQLLMAVPGLSLLHVKSHLQKYRNALADGRPAGPRSRPAAVGCRRRSVMSKRSAANMRSSDSNGDGSGSDGEWEEDVGSGAGSGAGSPTAGLGLGGFPEQLSRRNSKHYRPSQPEEEAAPEQQLGVAASGAVAQQGAAAGSLGAHQGSLGQPLPSLVMGWGTASDFVAVEAELEAALAPVDAQLAALGPEAADAECGTDDEDGALLDLPEGLAMLDRQLSREGQEGSQGPCPTGSGTPPPSGGSGNHSSSSGLAMTTAAPLAAVASPSTLAGPTEPSPPDAADAFVQQHTSSGGSGNGSGSGRGNKKLLEAALRMQLEMQRQLSSTMEAQRQLQKQLEEHGRYIEGLLRSEGALSSKPAPKAAASSKPRASAAMHRRSASTSSVGRPRATSGTASPAVECSLPLVGGWQPLAPPAQLPLPPLALPVPPLAPGWHAAPQAQAAPGSRPQQAQQAQQAQHAEGWLDQLMPAGEAQRAEQEAAASQLSPSDVDLLLAADGGLQQQLLHQPCGLPAAGQQQQAGRPAASQFSQRSHLSDGTQMAPAAAAGPASESQQAQQVQQAQQALVGEDMNADMWDSLLVDSGVLHQLLAEEGRQAA